MTKSHLPNIKQTLFPLFFLFLSFSSPKTSAWLLWKPFQAKSHSTLFFISQSSNNQKEYEHFPQYQQTSKILETPINIPSHSDKFNTLAIKNAKQKREARPAMINLKQSLTANKIGGCNNKEIGKTPCKVLALTLKFASLPQGKISKMFQN